LNADRDARSIADGGAMTATPLYHEGMRQLQDLRETRPLADRLAEVIVRSAFTDDDRTFIQRCNMMFVATADHDG